jgi:methylthioribose-1-phosphate isomerase
MIAPVRLEAEGVVLLDQRRLPGEETSITCGTVPEVVAAIRDMVVRGAPAIGVTAAYGLVVAARAAIGAEPDALQERLHQAGRDLAASRPTAVNLAWAVRRVLAAADEAFEKQADAAAIAARVEQEARAIHEEDIAANRSMGRHGAVFIPDGARVLTHCNAGALATAGYGTALGLVRAAVEDGKAVNVLADETRPFLQGARLTAWELQRDGIPVSVIADSMAGALMSRGEIDLVVVGADRVAINGDVANKIGTYSLAVLARRHGIPFYVAAPLSTIDPDCPNGEAIPIEERSVEEVTHFAGQPVAPAGVGARHPAFDVTPAELVTAIVTEAGIARPPLRHSLPALLGLPVDEEEEPAGDAEPADDETDIDADEAEENQD